MFLPENMLPGPVAYHVCLPANLLIALLFYGSLVALPAVLVVPVLSALFRGQTWARSTGPWASVLLLAFVLMAPMPWIHRTVYWPLPHKAVRAVHLLAHELVSGINRYKQNHGAPLPELGALQPDYLSEISGIKGIRH